MLNSIQIFLSLQIDRHKNLIHRLIRAKIMPTVTIMPNEHLIAKIDAIQVQTSKCYYDSCSKESINSHTIPENYLYKLNKDLKNILTFQPAMVQIVNKQSPKIIRCLDKDKFSTFRGFCREHDNELFKPIDLYDGNIDKEKAALIHYKNICYGINHIETQKARLTHLTKQTFIPKNTSNKKHKKTLKQIKNGILFKRLNFCLNEYFKRKSILEKMIESRDFSKIDFRMLPCSFKNPIFCGRSTYLLHKDNDLFTLSGYSYLPWISYMTLLTSSENHLVFCWLEIDSRYSKHLKRLLKHKAPKDIIAVLAYACSDAFAVESEFYDKHSQSINQMINRFRVY